MTDALSRRRLLAGTAVAAVTAPVAALPALGAVAGNVASEPHPDAALLDLGHRFDAAHLEWEAMRPARKALDASIAATVEAWKPRPDVATRAGRDNSPETWEQIFAEADPAGVRERADRLVEQEIDPLTMAILRAPPPATIEGLAVKARALTFTTKESVWEEPDTDQLDFDEAFICDVVENLCRLAGVDRFGRPTAPTA